MTNALSNSISVQSIFDLEAAPDCGLIKLHFTGEGMTLEDAVATAHRKVMEAKEGLQSNHSSIQSIRVFNVYVGQKEDRLRSEALSFPRPLVVQGVLIVTSPTDYSAQYRIVDEGIKRGAFLENPQRRPYMSDSLDSAILYGVVDSEKHVKTALEKCLERAASLAHTIADCSGKRIGKLISISGASVESSMNEIFRKDYSHISKSFPTKFLSPTPEKVILSAKLVATYETSD